MTVELELNELHKVAADFRMATLGVEVMEVHSATRVSGQLLPRSRLNAALLAFSLAAGLLVHPTASLDVQVLTPVVIGLSELPEIYNYTDVLGRYIVTSDGYVFEVRED